MAAKGENMPATTGLSLRSKLVIAGMAALIGILLGATVFGPGAANAQEATTTTTSTTEESSTTRGAQRQERIREALEPLVTDGTITSAQADAVSAQLSESFPGHHLRRFHASLDVAAATIGITEAELVSALREGQSVAEVAEANGVSAQTVIDALVSEINTRVDEALAAGTLDEERATEIKANAVEKATSWVNGELPLLPRGGLFGRGPEGGETPDAGA